MPGFAESSGAFDEPSSSQNKRKRSQKYKPAEQDAIGEAETLREQIAQLQADLKLALAKNDELARQVSLLDSSSSVFSERFRCLNRPSPVLLRCHRLLVVSLLPVCLCLPCLILLPRLPCLVSKLLLSHWKRQFKSYPPR